MKLQINGLWIKAMVKAGYKNDEFVNYTQFGRDTADNWLSVDSSRLQDAELEFLRGHVQALILKSKDTPIEGARGLIQKIAIYRKLKANPTGVKVSRLESLEMALKEYVQPSPHKWLFMTESDGYPMPYFVTSIKYQEANSDRGDNPASTTVELSACQRGSSKHRTISFRADQLGKTVMDLLVERGIYLETPDMVKEYFDQIEVFKQYSPQTGAQFNATGMGQELDGYWSTLTSMVRDGAPAQVVMDDVRTDEDDECRGRKDNDMVVSGEFWAGHKKRHERHENDDSTVVVPLHPYVKVFDLKRHVFCLINAILLEPYVYDAELIHKLVLPDDKKKLLGILVAGSSTMMEDIVKGKTGGIIVIATGPPGTGKTLSAEVFSEEMKRPLYAVQCSQLGTSEEALEKQLQTVLARAARWKAILLIDEADVYVHERGDDIQQNAIVGVFLRILEHYRGILFMTSNRSTIIDDAIMSRATAWIKYDFPSPEESYKIWTVLSTNYEAGLSHEEINELVAHFKVSGRSIKNLLRLAKLLSLSQNEELTVDTVKYVSQFLDLERKKD